MLDPFESTFILPPPVGTLKRANGYIEIRGPLLQCQMAASHEREYIFTDPINLTGDLWSIRGIKA